MLTATTSFSRGETFTPALEAVQGSIAGATCRMAMKRATPAGLPPGDGVPDAAELAVVAVDHVDPEDATSGPGWVGTLAPADSEALEPGVFLMDARIELGGAVIQSSMVKVVVGERVTTDG